MFCKILNKFFNKEEKNKEDLYNKWLYSKSLFEEFQLTLNIYKKDILKQDKFQIEVLEDYYEKSFQYIGTYIEKNHSISNKVHLFYDTNSLMSWFLENGKNMNPECGQAIYFSIGELLYEKKHS